MSDIAIVVAKKEGGLDAALNGSGYQIIAGTRREFTSLATLTDVPMKGFGHINTGESGWIALAEHL